MDGGRGFGAGGLGWGVGGDLGADGGGRGEAARRSGDLLSTRRRLRARGTGTVSGGLAGAPSLALETLAGIFFRGPKSRRELGQLCSAPIPQLDTVSVLTQNIDVALLTPRNWRSECALEEHHQTKNEQ